MKSVLSNIYEARYVLMSMVAKDVKSRYKGSALGPVWVFAAPLYQLLLYTFLFSTILKVRFDVESGTSSFVLYLLAGLIPWIFFSEATVKGTSSFIENVHIIKKVKFPIEVCVLSALLSSAVTFLVYMVLYLAALVVTGTLKFHTLPLFLLPLITQILLTLGLSFGLGSIAVFFRDVIQIVGMMLNLVFFLTPIVYPAEIIPQGVRWMFNINPFYFLVEAYRNVLLKGVAPSPVVILYPLVIAVLAFFGGYFFFAKTKEAFKDTL